MNFWKKQKTFKTQKQQKDQDSLMKDFKKSLTWEKIFNFKGLIKFLNKHQKQLKLYNFYASLIIFVIMFFVALFLNAKVGYYLNGVHFNQENSLLIPAIILGIIALLLYISIIGFEIFWFVQIVKKTKKITLLDFSLNLITFSIAFLFLILIFVFIFLNYQLFYLFEIILIFHLLIEFYYFLSYKYDLNFKLLQKLTTKEIRFSKTKKTE